ncbi:hypothetical protein GCM10022244_30440 [Streptomyces gulbargensis]|uniref:Uncharacterized protein n=1 Tax=Streptomyces gulbargensis TaxID=364901 RepID=A0ABP7MBI2_9ACTN
MADGSPAEITPDQKELHLLLRPSSIDLSSHTPRRLTERLAGRRGEAGTRRGSVTVRRDVPQSIPFHFHSAPFRAPRTLSAVVGTLPTVPMACSLIRHRPPNASGSGCGNRLRAGYAAEIPLMGAWHGAAGHTDGGTRRSRGDPRRLWFPKGRDR